MDSVQILMSKSRISNLGGVTMVGITVIECLYGRWFCKLKPVPLAYLRDSRPCSLHHRALPWAPEILLLCSPLPFSPTACSSAPALQGPLLLITYPSTRALCLGNPRAFECIRMCFCPSSLCIFLLCNVVRTLLNEDLLHIINPIQLVIIFGKRAYKKKIKMRWLICNSYSRKFFAESLRLILQSIQNFFSFSVIPFTCIIFPGHWIRLFVIKESYRIEIISLKLWRSSLSQRK